MVRKFVAQEWVKFDTFSFIPPLIPDGVSRARIGNVIFQNLEMFLSSTINKYVHVTGSVLSTYFSMW